MKKFISTPVIRRLPRYCRFLADLQKNGVTRISSRELSQKMGLTASQIRQDLNCFGGFGQQGYGYNVAGLRDEITGILGIGRQYKLVIIGAGNLGHALAAHMPFEQLGFSLVGIFDKKASVAGQLVRGLPVRPMETLDEFCNIARPDAAALCIPTRAAPEICAQLSRLGVKAVWNFTHYDVGMNHPELVCERVHLNDSLMTLCYMMNNPE
ncbi:MAG: redox-sensing transcriptional repressor Rex [Oscillospiraceae bacterium]|jgi:redox-sensing transcriptional repressor|nr:redox-sensing transcriptional repressor Rex [Oscillospiraceae bacterium]